MTELLDDPSRRREQIRTIVDHLGVSTAFVSDLPKGLRIHTVIERPCSRGINSNGVDEGVRHSDLAAYVGDTHVTGSVGAV